MHASNGPFSKKLKRRGLDWSRQNLNLNEDGGSQIFGSGFIAKICDVRVPLKRQKTLSEDKVLKLAESILADGQTTPIQLRSDGNGYVLIEGLHRLEALRLLGEASVQAYFVRARLH